MIEGGTFSLLRVAAVLTMCLKREGLPGVFGTLHKDFKLKSTTLNKPYPFGKAADIRSDGGAARCLSLAAFKRQHSTTEFTRTQEKNAAKHRHAHATEHRSQRQTAG